MLQSRRPIAYAAVAFLAIVLLLDSQVSRPANPYKQPAFLALGSGEQASGALCTAQPPQ